MREWTVDADFANWTDPVKLPALLVAGVLVGVGTFLQDPKGAVACEHYTFAKKI